VHKERAGTEEDDDAGDVTMRSCSAASRDHPSFEEDS
jgi:hypothetical protein